MSGRARRRPSQEGQPSGRLTPLKVAFLTVRASPVVAGPVRYARTVAAELADPLTPLLGTGAAATAVLGEATDAVLVGGAMVGSALISGFQRLRAETVLESLLLEQAVVAHREIRGGRRRRRARGRAGRRAAGRRRDLRRVRRRRPRRRAPPGVR